MTDKIKVNDFIEIDYTGRLTDGALFDTTIEKDAKASGLSVGNRKFSSQIICVGEHQVPIGLDEDFIGKDVGASHTLKLSPEKAFGKRDIHKIKVVPATTFKEHKLTPHPGLQVDMDGELGIVTQISGGRVLVNFNHPLSGKEVVYTYTIKRKVESADEKISAYLNQSMRLPKETFKVNVVEHKADVTLPFQLPPEFVSIMEKKLQDLTGLKEIKFELKKA
ncbi:peptidylprolyl isomerase [Candidatus Woesearchaeota archaeon]|nr:peptidylprolyl isomerase [Candidatus Woesearchaeota archaeon]